MICASVRGNSGVYLQMGGMCMHAAIASFVNTRGVNSRLARSAAMYRSGLHVSEVAKRAEIIGDRHLRMEIRLAGNYLQIFPLLFCSTVEIFCIVLGDSKEIIFARIFQFCNSCFNVKVNKNLCGGGRW
jgi:hypothetical protein